MKILQVSYSLTSGGGERFVVDLSNELSKNKEYKVTLLTIVDDTPLANRHYLNELSKEVKYVNLKVRSGLNIKAFIKIFTFIKQTKPDIVHIHCSDLLFYMPAIFLKHPQYILTLHSIVEHCLKFKFQKYIDKFFFKKKLIHPVTISQECHKSYEQVYKLSNDNIIINGRSQLPVSSHIKDVQKEIESYKQSSNDKIFIHIARYHPVKNQQLLFEVFKTLSQKGINYQLLIIGSGFENCKISEVNNIHLLGEKKNVGDYLTFSDYFILTSLIEGLPLSLLEAMSFGVIPITTPAGGLKDVIKHKVNGFISPSFSYQDMMQTIQEALDKGILINKDSLKQEYFHKYSMKACSSSYIQLYTNIIKD